MIAKRSFALLTWSFFSFLFIGSLLCMSAKSEKRIPTTPQSPQPLRAVHSEAKKDQPLPTFKGVGNKNGKLETGFCKENSDYKRALKDEKEGGGVELPEGLQDVVNNAERLLKNIDDGTLKAVSTPLSLLGLEAEKARIRPMNGGIGLGVSINLEKKKKKDGDPSGSADVPPPSASTKKENERVYELISPKREEPDRYNGH